MIRANKSFLPDNRRPVIIRIDDTNLLLMIRKMRSSRPHFKYIFIYIFYREADWETLLIPTTKTFTGSFSPSEMQDLCFTRCNVFLWLDCHKLKAFVLKLRGGFQFLSFCRKNQGVLFCFKPLDALSYSTYRNCLRCCDFLPIRMRTALQSKHCVAVINVSYY